MFYPTAKPFLFYFACFSEWFMKVILFRTKTRSLKSKLKYIIFSYHIYLEDEMLTCYRELENIGYSLTFHSLFLILLRMTETEMFDTALNYSILGKSLHFYYLNVLNIFLNLIPLIVLTVFIGHILLPYYILKTPSCFWN